MITTHYNDPVSIGQLNWGPMTTCEHCHAPTEDLENHEASGCMLCPDCLVEYLEGDNLNEVYNESDRNQER